MFKTPWTLAATGLLVLTMAGCGSGGTTKPACQQQLTCSSCAALGVECVWELSTKTCKSALGTYEYPFVYYGNLCPAAGDLCLTQNPGQTQTCSTAGGLDCGGSVCCPAGFPYRCTSPSGDNCYKAETDAYAACGYHIYQCDRCVSPGISSGGGTGTDTGTGTGNSSSCKYAYSDGSTGTFQNGQYACDDERYLNGNKILQCKNGSWVTAATCNCSVAVSTSGISYATSCRGKVGETGRVCAYAGVSCVQCSDNQTCTFVNHGY